MPSAAFARWQNERMARLSEVNAHCAVVFALVPPNPTFLYTECSQIWIASIAAALQPTAEAQFSAHLALEKGNPTYDNVKKDFNRFGFRLDLQAAHPLGPYQVTDLGHLNDWRNKAAHQGTQPLGGGVPPVLSIPIVQNWRVSCDGLAASLDGIMQTELLRIMGVAPW